MAATITSLATGTSSSSSSSVSTGSTVTATVADKDWLVVLIAAVNGGSNNITGVTDGSGNTYTQRATRQYTAFPGTGGCIGIYTTEISTDITGGQVTASFSPDSSAKAIHVYRYRPGTGEVASFVSADTVAGSVAASHSTGAVSVTNADTIFCMAGINTDTTRTGDSDTTNGSWSSLVAVNVDASIDISSQSQYKTVSATGNQTWTITGGSTFGIPGYVILRVSSDLSFDAAGGSYAITGTNATVEHGWVVVASGGSYAITGTDINAFNIGLTIAAETGSYAVTGVNTSLEHGWAFDAAAGSYAITGTDATFNLTSDKRIALSGGSYAITGTNALLQLFTEAEVASGGMPLKYYAPRVHCYVEVTPVVQAAAYAANDIVFTATEVENATWRSTPGGEEMFLQSILILDVDDNPAANWTFYFARGTFTLGTINDVVNISDDDANLITSAYTLASTSFFDVANSKFGYATNLNLSVTPKLATPQTKSIWVAATTAGTPTFSSDSSIKLKLHFVS